MDDLEENNSLEKGRARTFYLIVLYILCKLMKFLE